MFEAWGRSLYRARRLTIVAGLLFAVAAGIWGTGVFGKLNSGNTFSPPNSQSSAETALPPASSAATAPTSSSCSAPRRTRSPTRSTGRR